MNNYSSAPDVTAKQPASGGGLMTSWRCMGCNRTVPHLGSKGKGVRKRCAACLAASTKPE